MVSDRRPLTEIVALDRLKPARVNDRIYKPVDPADPKIIQFGEEIVEQGLLEPLVATLDDVIQVRWFGKGLSQRSVDRVLRREERTVFEKAFAGGCPIETSLLEELRQ